MAHVAPLNARIRHSNNTAPFLQKATTALCDYGLHCIRLHRLEGDIKIKVMDQDVVGHDEVCFINLEPKTVSQLAQHMHTVSLHYPGMLSGSVVFCVS